MVVVVVVGPLATLPTRLLWPARVGPPRLRPLVRPIRLLQPPRSLPIPPQPPRPGPAVLTVVGLGDLRPPPTRRRLGWPSNSCWQVRRRVDLASTRRTFLPLVSAVESGRTVMTTMMIATALTMTTMTMVPEIIIMIAATKSGVGVAIDAVGEPDEEEGSSATASFTPVPLPETAVGATHWIS